jgi:uncharacterized protein (TIRG00374 family)
VTGTDGEAGKTQRGLLLFGGLFAVLVVGALFLSLRHASPVVRSWTALSALLIAQPFAFLAIWFPGARLARLAGPPAATNDAFLANAVSVVAFMIVPGRLSEALKPVVLRLRCGLPLARGLTAVALERLLDLGCLALLALLAAGGAAAQYAGGLRQASIVLGLLLVAALAVLFIVLALPGLGRRLVDRVPVAWVRSAGHEMLDAVERVRDVRTLVAAITLSLLTWAASYLIFYVVIGLIGTIGLSPAQILLVFVAGTLGFVVTVTPGGLGTYEGAIMLALGSLGYDVADALAIALLLRIANLLPAVPASAWYLARSGVALSDLASRARRGRDEP